MYWWPDYHSDTWGSFRLRIYHRIIPLEAGKGGLFIYQFLSLIGCRFLLSSLNPWLVQAEHSQPEHPSGAEETLQANRVAGAWAREPSTWTEHVPRATADLGQLTNHGCCSERGAEGGEEDEIQARAGWPWALRIFSEEARPLPGAAWSKVTTKTTIFLFRTQHRPPRKQATKVNSASKGDGSVKGQKRTIFCTGHRGIFVGWGKPGKKRNSLFPAPRVSWGAGS